MSHPEYTADKIGSPGPSLERQVTLSLSPDQYERLFFQPSRAKGDFSKRLGNPTLIGLLAFLVPYSIIMFSFLQFRGSSPASLVGISGASLFFGGIALQLAGIFEFILGNTFPMAVFIVYGCHLIYTAYTASPLIGIVDSYAVGELPGALSQEYNAGQGHYYLVMALVSFVFLCGSLRINVPFVLAFFGLVFLFSFAAAGFYQLGYNPTAAGVEHAYYYFKIGGGFGFVTMCAGWYLALITACASTGVPCPLPVFDLSQRLFVDNVKGQKSEHDGAITSNAGHSA